MTRELERDESGGDREPEQPQTLGRVSRGKIGGILISGALIAAAATTWFWLHYRDRVSTDDAQVDGHIAPISSKIAGSVLQVLVENNQPVKAGQVLVRIDPRDYQARVDQAAAALAVAESLARAAQVGVPLIEATTASGTAAAAAQLATAEAEYNRARIAADQAGTSEVEAARANVTAAEAGNERAQADLARMRPLAAKAEISRQQLDAYVAAARVAEAQLRAARERLSATVQAAQNARAAADAAGSRVQAARAALDQSRAGREQVKVSAAQASSAQANVQQARANLEAARLQLSYASVTAPLDGVVTKKTVEPGQIVQPGQGLMSVIPLQDVWVTANFKETQLAAVRPGQRAEVDVDMYGRSIAGRVDSIAGATGARLSLLPPENATGNFVKVVQRIPVKIVFDKLPEGVVLRPGMNVHATILTR
ncbi:MAG: HlyD family secretion protein [Bryobacteraceae bacterium]